VATQRRSRSSVSSGEPAEDTQVRSSRVRLTPGQTPRGRSSASRARATEPRRPENPRERNTRLTRPDDDSTGHNRFKANAEHLDNQPGPVPQDVSSSSHWRRQMADSAGWLPWIGGLKTGSLSRESDTMPIPLTDTRGVARCNGVRQRTSFVDKPTPGALWIDRSPYPHALQ
jgi:hypothetical protein